jgi:hypothetical protein
MNFTPLIIKNIFNLPLICFLCGIFLAFIKPGLRLLPKVNKFLVIYILFCVGLKGGGPLAQHSLSSALLFSIILSGLILWGSFSPLLSFYLLRWFTRVDGVTAAAIAASFGSVSVMTFITALSFLDQIEVGYQQLIIAALAIMEIPAIISGIFLAKKFDKSPLSPTSTLSKLLVESLFNKAIVAIVIGLIVGVLFYVKDLSELTEGVLLPFKPLLCLFLLDMGLNVGSQREHFRTFSWQLHLFGLYMPLIGGSFGIFLSYLLGLDVGTGTLIAVLTASASYIAVPAAMQIALPQAKQAIYLPLSLGIAFPFNVIIGIPLYYYLAICFLK